MTGRLGAAHIARLTGYHHETINQWRRAGRMPDPAGRYRGAYWWDADEALDWIEQTFTPTTDDD